MNDYIYLNFWQHQQLQASTKQDTKQFIIFYTHEYQANKTQIYYIKNSSWSSLESNEATIMIIMMMVDNDNDDSDNDLGKVGCDRVNGENRFKFKEPYYANNNRTEMPKSQLGQYERHWRKTTYQFVWIQVFTHRNNHRESMKPSFLSTILNASRYFSTTSLTNST